MGLGLFANKPILDGEFIIEYTGELISTEGADSLSTKYLFAIDENYTFDGSDRKNIARYINHLCTPNIEAQIEAGEIKFFALQNIKEGEEFGYDYGKEYFKQFIKPRGCKCPSCRLGN